MLDSPGMALAVRAAQEGVDDPETNGPGSRAGPDRGVPEPDRLHRGTACGSLAQPARCRAKRSVAERGRGRARVRGARGAREAPGASRLRRDLARPPRPTPLPEIYPAPLDLPTHHQPGVRALLPHRGRVREQL